MSFRPMKVLAAAWLLIGVGLAVLIGPSLGWRGWIWFGAHELLCLVGASWELLGGPSRGAGQEAP